MIYQNLASLRAEAIKIDLKPDAFYIVKGKQINYVTLGALKRQFAPLFGKAGLDLSFEMGSVKDTETGVRITVKFILRNESGETDVSTVVSEATRGDKAIVIALSYAMRMYLNTKFCLADGIDSEDGEDIEDVLAGMGIPDTPKKKVVQTPIPTPSQVQTFDRPLVTTAETDDNGKDKVTPTPAPEMPANGTETPSVSMMELKAVAKAKNDIDALRSLGKITDEQYLKVQEMVANISSSADVHALLEYRKGLVSPAEVVGGM